MPYFLFWVACIVGVLLGENDWWLVFVAVLVVVVCTSFYLRKASVLGKWGLFATIGLVAGGLSSAIAGSPEVFAGQRCVGRVVENYSKGASVLLDRCEPESARAGNIYVSCYGKSCPDLYAVVEIEITSRSGVGSFSGKGVFVKHTHPLVSDTDLYYELLRKGNGYRQGYFRWLNEALPLEQSALLTSMLFGETQLSTELKSIMKDLGIVHVIAISGINIRYLQGLVTWIVRGFRRKIRGMIETVPLVLLFVVVGPVVSLLRAIGSAVIAGLCRSFGLLQNGFVIFFVVAILLLWSPKYLYDAGYWLVSAASIGIYVIVPKTTAFWRNSVIREIGSTAVIWLCVAPVQLIIFGNLTPLGIVVGAIIGPLVEIASIAGYAGVIVRYLPVLGDLLRFFVGIVVSIMLLVVNMFHGSD